MCIVKNKRFTKEPKNKKRYSLMMLPLAYKPGANDILCGRGNVFSNHEGNRRFGNIIRDSLRKYKDASSRPEKIMVVDGIHQEIQFSGARFAKIDSNTKRWYELNPVQAHQKIGHAIRDTMRLLKGRENDTNPKTKPLEIAKRNRRSLILRNQELPSSNIQQISLKEIIQMSIDTTKRLNNSNGVLADTEKIPPTEIRSENLFTKRASITDSYRLKNEYPEESFDFSPVSFFEEFRRAIQ